MSEWAGIDLRGRTMLYPPRRIRVKRCGPSGRRSDSFPRSSDLIIEILTAFKEAGGSVEDLVKLLNLHLPPSEQKINAAELFEPGYSYSAEFHFYISCFTKFLLDDVHFRYKIDEKTQLGIQHLIFEKGPLEFPPWIIDDGHPPAGYLSITNLTAMFCYTEEAFIPPGIGDAEAADAGLKITVEALSYLNRCAPERYQAERSFFEKEGILISFEYLFYGAAIFTCLTNDEFFTRHAHYFGYLNSNQLARAIFLQPDLSPVKGFQEWQSRTNNIYKMGFRSGRRNLRIRLHLRQQVQTGMFGIYENSTIDGIQQAVPAVYRAIMELATQKRVRTRILPERNSRYAFTVKICWRAPYPLALTHLLGGIFGIAAFSAAFTSRLLLPPRISTMVIAVFLGIIIGVMTVAAMSWRNRLKAVKARFMASKDVIGRQLDSLKSTTNELLAERDSLELKVAERTSELNAALEQLKDLDRSKTNFIANVSHELRTPLTLLSVPLEAVKSGRYGNNLPADHPVFSLINRNVIRLKTRINQLLDYSRLDLGTMAFEPRQIELLGYCRLLVAELQSLAEQKGLFLRIDNRTGLDDITVTADGNLLDDVLLNLLNNSFKFTEKGGITLIISHSPEPGRVLLTIQDTGTGFHPDEKSRLFKRFSQAEQNRQRRNEGAGLGLALVKEIADLHGWTLDAEARPGEGASFFVGISLGESPSPGFAETEQQYSAGADRQERVEDGLFIGDGASAGACSPEKDSILLIEDNPDLGLLLKDLLCAEYNLHWCPGGEEAIRWLESKPRLSLIISDVMMPGMDGFTFREELLKDRYYRNLPFIYLTALADPGDKAVGLRSGAVDYIQKPFTASELFLKIKNLIESHKFSYLQALQDHDAAERLVRSLSDGPSRSEEPDWDSLAITKAERKVADLVRNGLQDKEIADRLSVSPRTVSSHLSHLYQKTGTQNRIELINLLYKQNY